MIKRKVQWVRLGVELALAAWGLGVLWAACETFPVEHREPITVRLLNGRSGQPLARARLTLIAGYTGKDLEQRLWQDETVTDATGEALLPRALRDFPFLEVRVAKTKLCQDTSHGETYNVERIRSEGLRAPNHCGFVMVAESPRVLVVFARSGGEPEASVQAPAEARVDFASGAGGDSETAPNELSRGSARELVRTSNEIGVVAGRALAAIAASVSAREAEAGPAWAATGNRNEIDALLIRRETGFSEPTAPLVEGTEDSAESYETMCQPED